MADKSAGAIFIDLGLDITQLESDFIAANQTIQQNLNRLNRERNLIELRAQVEIGNLDETADAAQILSIRTQALNQQIQIQRDRIRLTEAAFRQLTQSQGATTAATQNMEMRLQREQISLQRLEQQLQSTTTAQNSSGESAGTTADSFGGLDSLLERMPPQLKAAAAGFTAIGGAIVAAGAASSDLIERWRELQTAAYNLNMSVNDTENLLRHMRFAGTEMDDFEGYIRGITDAWSKGKNLPSIVKPFEDYGL